MHSQHRVLFFFDFFLAKKGICAIWGGKTEQNQPYAYQKKSSTIKVGVWEYGEHSENLTKTNRVERLP